jgi:metal-responsive CopG/Arc/MetJ family transcriptional regulator
MARTTTPRKLVSDAPRRQAPRKSAKERVLIEFPSADLRRADEAARSAGVSRSEFIRAAVELRLEAIAEEEFERELEESYKANAEFNLQILKEFQHVDRETWERLP